MNKERNPTMDVIPTTPKESDEAPVGVPGAPMMTDGIESGYVKLFRKIKGWPLYGDPAAFKVFMDVLIHCRWQAGDVFIGGNFVHLEAGQMVWGRAEASKRNGLSEKRTRGGLDRLVKGNCLKRAGFGAGLCSIITVVNWESYQGDKKRKGQGNGQSRARVGPGRGQPRATKKKGSIKEGKQEEDKQHPAANDAAGSSPSPYRQFCDEWCREWKRVHDADYPFQKKDGVAAAAVWKYANQDIGVAMEIVERYLLEPSPFYAGHPLTKLSGNLAQFAAKDPDGIGDPNKAGGREPTPEELRDLQEAGLAPK
jgi:hypothetical protein